MTAPHSDLTSRLSTWPTARAARRRPPHWATVVDLNRFETAADAAAAAKDDPELFASLAQRAADETATLVCLSTLAPALTAVVARWRRSGLPGQEVEEAEAELVAEVLAVLRGRSALPAGEMVEAASKKVFGRRRTARSRAARLGRLDDLEPIADGPTATGASVRTCLTEFLGPETGSEVGVVAWATACGWSGSEAAGFAGCGPTAWRSRKARALRSLRSTLAVA